jgi:heat-inducible transcriptional repressor
LSGLSDNVVITGIENQSDFFKSGLKGLFSMPEFKEFDRIFEFASFFDEFDRIFSQLEHQFLTKEGTSTKNVNVIIGQENPAVKVGETVMIAKYDLPNGFTGTLTLVGPTRMNYERNIGLIKYTTKEVKKKIK